MPRLVIDIPDDLMEQLDSWVRGDRRALAVLVRKAILEFLETFSGTTRNMG